MNKMSKVLWKINISQNVNRWIYFYRKIPLLGELMSVKAYNSLKLKRRLSILTFIVNTGFKFLSKLMFVMIVLYLPIILTLKEVDHDLLRNYVAHMFIIISLFCGSLINGKAAICDKDAYVAIKIFKIAPKKYEQFRTGFDFSLTLLFLGISFLILANMIFVDQPIIFALFLCIYFACTHIWGENLELYIFKKHHSLYKRYQTSIVIITISLIAIVIPIMTQQIYDAYSILMNPLLVILALIGTYFGIKKRKAYCFYGEVYREGFIRNKQAFEMDTFKSNMAFADVKLKGNIDVKLSDKVASLHGYPYFNKIFFLRHKRLLRRPLFFRLGYVAVVFIICLFGIYFAPEMKKTWNDTLIMAMPSLVFVMYLANITDKLVRAMFYNCDIAMLHYPFYRRKKTILSNFITRLRIVIAYNSIIAFSIIFVVIVIQMIYGIPFEHNLIIFSATLFLLSIFFSTHNLCMYYLFQPYTQGLGVKNPYFSAINTIVYIICFICLQVQSAPVIFSFVVLIATILYIIIALILVYVHAPKTFRIKH